MFLITCFLPVLGVVKRITWVKGALISVVDHVVIGKWLLTVGTDIYVV